MQNCFTTAHLTIFLHQFEKTRIDVTHLFAYILHYPKFYPKNFPIFYQDFWGRIL